MAENKKSFVLYTDQIGIFQKLTNEQAGLLIKHIFSYCNDEDPEGDFITDLAFESIKQQLKRDLVKYEKRADNSRENGKLGGRPKKPNKPSGLNNNPAKPKKPDTVNVTVNDNVTVNVNDNVNDIIYPFNSENFIKFWGLWKQYKKDEHRFRYKTAVTEQAALKKIGELSNNDEFTAIKIIEESIANGYKGLFAIKNQNNGTNQSNGRTVANRLRDTYSEKIRKQNQDS
jgi:hypothetical protein